MYAAYELFSFLYWLFSMSISLFLGKIKLI